MHAYSDRPAATEYAPFYAGYVAQAPDGDILAMLGEQAEEFCRLAASVPGGEEGRRYAPGKWSIIELLGHLIDGERVFGYRAFRFSRNDSTPLEGFDEDAYVANGWFGCCTAERLGEEFLALRRSHILMFSSLPPEAWQRCGVANGNQVSVRALAYIMLGHVAHHLAVLRERYLDTEARLSDRAL